MEVYAGLVLIAFCIAFLVIRIFQSPAATSPVNEKGADSLQEKLRSHGRKQKGLNGLSTPGSRFKSTDKSMTTASRRSTVSFGTTLKPWGW